MSVPCFLSSAARSFSLPCPPAGLLCCRLRGLSSVTLLISPKLKNPDSKNTVTFTFEPRFRSDHKGSIRGPKATVGSYGVSIAIVRNMTSKRQMDHLERTASNYRQNALYPAQVCGIMNESETVKRLRIAVHPDFSFKAGQWVDLFIPGVEKVGGFSMCSNPGLLQREGVIELAVKYSKHPPAHWVHTECSVGSQVAMRVGGDFFFDPSTSDPSVDLLLVAGGVGINPLYSILLHTTDLLHLNRASGGRDYSIGSAHLCYSAKNTQELLFKNSIVEACREFPDKVSCDFHVTQQSTDVEPHLQQFLKRGRITEEELRAHVDPQRTLCFLCGPPPMIEAISKTLIDLGLSKDRILFEKWW